MGKIKIRKEMKDKIHDLYTAGCGVKRGAIKDKFNHSPLIHSRKTFETYLQQCDRFANWCMAQDPPYKFHDERLPIMITWYIEEMQAQGKSPWTQSTALSALCKAFEMRMEDIPVKLEKRSRSRITRSRQGVEHDRHINPEHYKTVYTFERCFGLRHHKELDTVKASDFFKKDGRLWCFVIEGKGGKSRQVPFCGSKEEETLIKRYIANHQEGVLFQKGDIPSGMDCHALRAEYASRMYHEFARDTKTLPRHEQYICRADKAGEIYDKKALKIVSQALGHNRECVVVDNYSYRF